jgi:hypothetical protein
MNTKEAIGLFRGTKYNFQGSFEGGDRSVLTSFWNNDGTTILVANLHGKAIKRMHVERDASGTITQLVFNKSASLGLGISMNVAEPAAFFHGPNVFGKPLLEAITSNNDGADR